MPSASCPPAPADVPTPASWDDLGPPEEPRFLLGVRSLIVREDRSGIEILPGFPEGWQGRPVEVHGLPTAAGTLSFAVRWHGERPAVLWEVRPSDPSAAPPVLRAPALDPRWVGRGWRGDALLRR
jgi:hypothetical protein